jgi:hypothetical protein
MPSVFKKATRTNTMLRMAIAGPSGAGKTKTSLEIATGIGGPIALIDTERGSASMYADLHDEQTGELVYDFDALELADFNPERYIEAIHQAEHAMYQVLIIDSLSHAWFGKGGSLDLVDEASQGSSNNSYFAWRSVTPLQNELVEAILQCSCHVICTLRTTTAYAIRSDRGKNVPEKIGLKPIQRPGLDYEFSLFCMMDQQHRLKVEKSRLGNMADKEFLRPDRSLGVYIMRELRNPTAPDKDLGAKAADDLYGEGAGNPLRHQPRQPAPSRPVTSTASAPESSPNDGLILEISALVHDSGRDVTQYWNSMCKRFKAQFSRNLLAETLAALKTECETYLAQQQQRKARTQPAKPSATTPPRDAGDESPDTDVPGEDRSWLPVWQEAAREALPRITDILLAGQVRDALYDETLTLFQAEELTERIQRALADAAEARKADETNEEAVP